MSVETVISAFSADYVGKLTGLTSHQLAYWDKVNLFKPSVVFGSDGTRPIKVYSFNDVVGLRVISVLRQDHKISVQELRKVAKKLETYSSTPWNSLKLMVCKGEVSFIDPKTGRGRGVFTGQGVLVPIIDQINYVHREVASLNKRSCEQVGNTTRSRNIAHNLHVFAGTRIPVRAVERFLHAGYSVDFILEEYPSLQREDVEAVQRERSKLAAA